MCRLTPTAKGPNIQGLRVSPIISPEPDSINAILPRFFVSEDRTSIFLGPKINSNHSFLIISPSNIYPFRRNLYNSKRAVLTAYQCPAVGPAQGAEKVEKSNHLSAFLIDNPINQIKINTSIIEIVLTIPSIHFSFLYRRASVFQRAMPVQRMTN